MPTGIGGELLWLCPTLGGDAADLTGLNTPSLIGGLASISHTNHGGLRAYSLDGVDDGLTIPHHSRFNFGTGDFTVTFWLYSTTATGMIVGKGAASGTFAGFAIRNNEGLVYNNSANSQSYVRDQAAWQFVVFQRLSGALKVSNLSGFRRSTIGSTKDMNNSADLVIGQAMAGWSGVHLSGLMDDIRVFGRAISYAEIGALSSQPGYEPPALNAGFTGLSGVGRLGT
jgi:hypothetical protein